MNLSLSMSIGVLAQRAGCTVPTIRYYEEVGLLPLGPRTEAGRRQYGEAAVRRLTFIRRCRDFGFSVEQVRELTGLVDEPSRPCMEVRDIASNRLAEVHRKLEELRALEQSLSEFVRSCDTGCAGGAAVDCTILDDLAVPAAKARVVARPCCTSDIVECRVSQL